MPYLPRPETTLNMSFHAHSVGRWLEVARRGALKLWRSRSSTVALDVPVAGAKDKVPSATLNQTIDIHLCMNALNRLMVALSDNEPLQREIELLASYLVDSHRLEMSAPATLARRAGAAIESYWRFLMWHRHGVSDPQVRCTFPGQLEPALAAQLVRATATSIGRHARPGDRAVRIEVFRDSTHQGFLLGMKHEAAGRVHVHDLGLQIELDH